MTPLTAEDRLLMKTSQIEKGWNNDKMIVEFLATPWNGTMLFELLQITDSTGNA